MRKIKFLLAMSLLVFVFSGCGGSAGGGDEESSDASELHTKIVSTLTGSWFFDDNDEFNGRATNTAGATIRLYSVKNFQMSVSDITFDNTTADSEASATVFYSYTSSARYENSETVLGDNFSIKSYTNSSTTKTQEMILARVTDEQWTLSSPSSNVPHIIITRSTPRKITVQFVGTTNFSAINDDCRYTITAALIRTSDTPTTDDGEDDGGEDESGIADILEGKWIFEKGSGGDEETEEAEAINDKDATSLTLKLASDVTLEISDVNLEPDENTTSLTGTVKVTYAQKWTAYLEDTKYGGDGAFAFSKSNETMKFVKITDSTWRIEDINNSNENIIITINSNKTKEIQTVWTGTTTPQNFDGDSYTYDITCSFRKQ